MVHPSTLETSDRARNFHSRGRDLAAIARRRGPPRATPLILFRARRWGALGPAVSLFHVFIERPRSTAPGAVTALAQAIAERYGIPAGELATRMSAGRFRVKGNVDRATADSYVADLARLGAVCTVVAADAAPPPSTTTPAVSLPRVERAPAPAPPPRATPTSSWPPPDVDVEQELGALSGSFPLTLSTLDGATEDEARSSRKIQLPASFAPPVALPASFAPPPEPVADTPSGAVDVAMSDDSKPVEVFDPFAPPEAQANAPELLLADDHKPRRQQHSDPPPPHPTAAAAPVAPVAVVAAATQTLAPRHDAPVAARSGGGWKSMLRDDATRLVAGAVLAVAIGAIPALLVGGARERAAFAALDGELDKRQSEIRTPDAYDGLDRVRATFVERKRAERQSIAITSLMIWAALSGGFTWLWFRKIDWDRVLA